jgi:spore coat protein U-like protein
MVRSSIACALLVCAWASSASAAQCTITTTPVNFGSYNVFATAPLDSTGRITLNCNGGAKNVWVGITSGGAPSVGTRRMVKGGEQFLYNLYRDAARTALWSDGTGGGGSVHIEPDPPNHKDMPITVFGRIPASQDVSAGTYADTVTVIVNY